MKYLFKIGAIICILFLGNNIIAQNKWKGNTTPTYYELSEHLIELSKMSEKVELYNMGKSDYGLPIYICIVNGAKDSLETFKKARKETTILFNNAIHPGEPDGINACLIWLDELIVGQEFSSEMPVVAFIPSYNVGGMINRSSNSRANQNGPNEYGFRGNAQNLDLNRDFIKMDSKNAFVFSKIFHGLDPDVFVDNHVSNGADYQYTLTYISSLSDRMPAAIKKITHESLLPSLKSDLYANYGIDLFPYVDLKGQTPGEGIVAFNDLPRYSMGYTALFQSLSFTVETHMLKPFPQRVQATLAFMKSLISWTTQHKKLIEKSRLKARKSIAESKTFHFGYESDGLCDSILFKGYEHSFPKHQITGLERLKYDTLAPYERNIAHYKSFEPKNEVRVPKYYFVGRQEKDVIKRLKANKVIMNKLKNDTIMQLGFFEVVDYQVSKRPYEGHFKLNNVQVSLGERAVALKAGDVRISSNQERASFIHSVLQPESEDSYFTWNFFDSYLQQKEYFSSYVFIDKIEEILNNDTELRTAYESKMNADKDFRESEWAQLYFIYKSSPYFEKSVNILPVFFMY
tara:strand:+ start:21105 stop:22823 length:1719 start_codon:yes stop_codon:yes gene_type:complete